MARTCERCGTRLEVLTRADARYCSSRCRVAAHRSRHRLPAEMTSRSRWLRWEASKRPITATGAPASSTDSTTWTDYTSAARSTVGAGLGFALGDGIGCIDLDHCLTDGVLNAWAAEFLERRPATYVEVSPSGTGLHVWGRLPEAPGRKIRDGRDIEVYSAGRYVTVTGRRWGRCPSRLADLSELVASL